MKKVVLLVVMLSGCAAPHYVRDDVTSEEAQRDVAECRYQADQATASIYDAIMRTVRRNELMETCLQAKGYRRG